MSYIFKKKFQIGELANIEASPKRVLIYEPEEYLAALYAHYLREHNFDVKHCPDLERVKEQMLSFAPQMLVYNIGEAQSLGAKLNSLLKLRQSFPEIFVVTTGFNTDSETLKTLLAAGIASHINRKLSSPNDLVHIIKTLI